jgi:hypothetical protein
MNDLTVAVVAYLSAGMHVLALTGKRPNPKYHDHWDWDASIHGLPESADEEGSLDAIFSDPTTTGVGILIPPHVLVADVDTNEAATLLAELAAGCDLSQTRVGRTPNGLHVWFLAPGADASVWLGGRTLLFKGFGGYVAAPPSRHFDEEGREDGEYVWLGDWAVIDWLPDAIERRIKFEHAVGATTAVKTKEGGVFLHLPTDAEGHWTWRGWSSWHIEGLCRAIIEAPDGNQNNLIAWASMQARDEGVPYESAMPLLLAAAIEGGHPEHRARATIKGAFKRARRG